MKAPYINYHDLYARNVIDRFKPLSNEEIRLELQATQLPFAVLMMQIDGDFNFSTVVRSANAFGAREAFYYGPRKRIDRRGMMGVYHYTPVGYLPTIDDVKALKKLYTFVALEQTDKSIPLDKFQWKTKLPPIILVGEESKGLTTEFLDLCDHCVEIEQRGSVRSLNAATAFSIAAYDFVNKFQNA